jgi:hydroxymethylpyrimidine pyrophosphatase-like HAD family hydrolase
MVATGKARGPWCDDVLSKLPPMPGVFMQGLLVHNQDGSILYEKWLEHEIVQACIDIAEVNNLTLAAYCGERIVAAIADEHTDRLIFYREPTPEGKQVTENAALENTLFCKSTQQKLVSEHACAAMSCLKLLGDKIFDTTCALHVLGT